MSPMNKIADALLAANDNETEAIDILVKQKQADTLDMANRTANASIVYSYVHNHKVGAMIVLACQTDFVARNEAFLGLAKDICMHICSTPITPEAISNDDVSEEVITAMNKTWLEECKTKPLAVIDKILDGKLEKYFASVCLLNQKFVKNEDVTIKQLVQSVSSTVGEKIEVKKFTKMTANELH